jgi:ABC-2 type transport system ATP-binding protein
MNAITIKNLVKVYKNGTKALSGINLEVKAGEFCALLGANGAGKTTIISVLTGIANKTSGEASVFNFDVSTDPYRARKLIGVVPQEFNFNMFESVLDIVANQAGYFGIERKSALQDAQKILTRLDLWDKRKVPSRNLSGGMKRRLMIARALINRPKLLILDEPTAGVDVELRFGMWEYLKELNKQGTTILLTTHYLEEVEQLCRRAAMIKNGSIVADDLVKNLLKLIDKENYVIHVEEVKSLQALSSFQPVSIDDHTFEVELDKKENMNVFLRKLADAGMVVADVRPKGNRMEKLFLKLLQ